MTCLWFGIVMNVIFVWSELYFSPSFDDGGWWVARDCQKFVLGLYHVRSLSASNIVRLVVE